MVKQTFSVQLFVQWTTRLMYDDETAAEAAAVVTDAAAVVTAAAAVVNRRRRCQPQPWECVVDHSFLRKSVRSL